MVTATLVSTMELVAAIKGALVSYAVLRGIKPSIALRQVKASVPLPKEVFFKKKPCHFMHGRHPVTVFSL